jgi:aminodeoxyfutalosine deaminase
VKVDVGSLGPAVVPYPKIELHVHLEATVRPELLFAIARRNGVALPVRTPGELPAYYRCDTFEAFVARWIATSSVLRRYDDFREIVVDYAGRAKAQGCVYIEAIFSPSEPVVLRGGSFREVFEGYCDGAAEAREVHGVEVRLTPDVTRDLPAAVGRRQARWAVKYRERGVVALSLGGSERRFGPEKFRRTFAIARDGGLRSAPHAGELSGGKAGAASIRGALDVLKADRIRHGIRAVDDAALLAELAERGVVCDVTPVSNLRTGAVASLDEHPLPLMLAAGVKCSISSDDPVLMDTDLERDCAAAVTLGHAPRRMYEHALAGAFCDDGLRARLRRLGQEHDWLSSS